MTLAYIIKFFSAMLIFLPLYLIIRKPWRNFEKREIFLAVFWLYLIALLSLTFKGNYQAPNIMISDAFQRLRNLDMINIIPFGVIPDFFMEQNRHLFMVNVVGNIVMFMPWGFGLPLLWRKNQSISRVAAFALGITVFIELYQLFIWRWVDVDDIMLNFTGGMLGGFLYFTLVKYYPRLKELSI